LPTFRLRTLPVIVALVAVIFAAWSGVSVRHKASFCQGCWADHHRRAAERDRQVAAKPGCPPKDAAGFLRLAREEELAARK